MYPDDTTDVTRVSDDVSDRLIVTPRTSRAFAGGVNDADVVVYDVPDCWEPPHFVLTVGALSVT